MTIKKFLLSILLVLSFVGFYTAKPVHAAGLDLTVNPSASFIDLGQSKEITYTAKNTGDPITNASLSVYRPDQLTITSMPSGCITVILIGIYISCPVGSLSTNQTKNYKFTVKLNSYFNNTISLNGVLSAKVGLTNPQDSVQAVFFTFANKF